VNEKRTFDFWYAVNNTEVVRMPQRQLETFGNTILDYHLLCELMDSVSQVRIREGRMQASQPQIITPEAYASTFLEGFGEEASRYMEWLKEHETEVRILKYGYRLTRESFNEYIVTDSLQAVSDRVQREVQAKGNPLSAVVIGVDEPWDVCLVKLFWEVVQSSAKNNFEQLQKRRMFEHDHGVPRGVREDIEAAFLAASRNPSLINALGRRLQHSGLFEEYQDRFFSLVRASKVK
jgi:hypothetical protein